MLKFPLKRTYKNILLTKNGTIYAYYKITPEIISRANLLEQEKYKKKFYNVLDNLVKYKDVHLQMLPKNMDLEERFENLSSDFDKKFYNCAKYYSTETINILKSDLGTIARYEFYIGIRLDGISINSENMKDTVKNTVGKTTDILANFLGYEIEVTDEYFYRFMQTEKYLYNDLEILNVERCTEDELNYLIRYNFLGNAVHNIEEESTKRGSFEIANAILDSREKGILKIDTENKTIYKSYLVLESTNILMNNLHIFERLQSFPLPIEINLKLKAVDKTMFNLKLSNKNKKQENEIQDEFQGKGKLNDESLRNKYLIDRLDSEDQAGKNFIEWLLVISLSSTDKEDLKKQISMLKQEIKMTNSGREKGNNLVCPIADQLQLFYLFLQGQELGLYKNWLQLSTTEAMAELLFGVTQRLGTNVGFYIGRIDKFLKSNTLQSAIYNSRDIVLFHPMLANQGIKTANTDSPHIAITGKTGNGKSFLAKLLYIYSLMLDIKSLYFDPKSEMKSWFSKVAEDEYNKKNYPLFVDLLNSISYLTIDYTKEENYGILDPITFLNGDEAKELTKEMFFEIIDVRNKLEIETAILEAVRNVVDRKEAGEIVGSLHVIEELQNHEKEEVKNAGNNLYEKTQNGMLKLLVYDGSNTTLSLNNKSTVLQVYGLDLPEATDSVDTYTDTQKKSLLVMQIIGKFMGVFGSNKDEKTIIFTDEAWSMCVTKIGRAIKKQLERVGRSMNNALVFITQLVGDIKDEQGIAGNYGCIFAFDEDQDRDNILQLLGLEPNDINYKILSNTVKGQCLFKDFYGRVSKLSVHCLFDEWTQSFKTVEKTEVAKAEERFN